MGLEVQVLSDLRSPLSVILNDYNCVRIDKETNQIKRIDALPVVLAPSRFSPTTFHTDRCQFKQPAKKMA